MSTFQQITSMTDQEFATLLRSVARVVTPTESARREREHDIQAGPWVANQIVRHNYGESRQA